MYQPIQIRSIISQTYACRHADGLVWFFHKTFETFFWVPSLSALQPSKFKRKIFQMDR